MTQVVARFRLLSGHYQATPWYHHVNEGLVEWPPSPFRLMRALLATGYTKLGWPDGPPPEQAAALIEKLCTGLPRYALPAITRAHSRHYMPLGSLDKGTGEPVTTKVFDTFAVVERTEAERDSFIWVSWSVGLAEAERALLRELIENMSYLGRAESWVEGRLVEDESDWPEAERFVVRPLEEGASNTGEVIEVMAPQTPQSYLAWRNAAFEGALVALDVTGKKPSAKQKEALLERFPQSLTLALCTPTGVLQKQGFSRAPSSRMVSYAYQESDSLRARARGERRRPSTERPQFMLFALASDTERGDVLPVASRTLRVAEIFHGAAVKKACGEGNDSTPPDLLSGKVNHKPRRGHDHAHYLPLSLHNKPRIDHVLAYCPAGFDGASQDALHAIRFLFDSRTKAYLLVTRVASGSRDAVLRQHELRVLKSSTRFTSLTPFICPRFVKRSGKDTIEGQVRAELLHRKLEPLSVEIWSAEDARNARFFSFERRRDLKPPPSGYPLGVTITFKEKTSGPIALGYGSHYGLGLFLPDL